MSTSLERTEAALARIGERDRQINAFVHVDADGARAAAAAADDRRRDDRSLGPLDGLIFAVKDNLAIAGKSWAAGIAGRREIIADEDASVVARLRGAGAVPIGRTNMEEAAFGAVTDNPTFGRTDNPRCPNHVAGGSSGGSAAAVAAGFADLALGTDTLGSVRIPAAYCGVFGLKPTFGLAGRGGLAMLAPSLDTVGVMAAEAELLWPAIMAITGVDPADPDSLPRPHGWAGRTTLPNLAGLRVAVPRQVSDVGCAPEILQGLATARDAMAALGAQVIDVDVAGWEPGPDRRAGLLMIEAEGAVELAGLMDRQGALSARLLAALRYGRDASATKVVRAAARLRAAGAAFHRVLASADLVLLPTAPQRAFARDAAVPENQADFTAPANCAGIPAVSLPVWLPAEALPAAVQLIGPAWSEARLTMCAELLAGALPGPRA